MRNGLIIITAVLLASGCSRSGGYVPLTYAMWAEQVRSDASDLVDITSLSDDQVLILRQRNPTAAFYWTTDAKRYMEFRADANYDGFWKKVYMTPVTIIIDGIVISIVAVVNCKG